MPGALLLAGALIVGTATAWVSAPGIPPRKGQLPEVFSVDSPVGVKPATPTGVSTGQVPGSDPSDVYLHSNGTEGVVATKPRVYLVFWGSQWSSDPAGAKPALQSFFEGLHGPDDTWGKILDQYCQGLAVGTVSCAGEGEHIEHPAASVLGGVWMDDSSGAPGKASLPQLAREAGAAASHFGNTTQTSNDDVQYVIASPHGTHPDGFPEGGFCSWHSSASTSSGTIAFTNLPYVPDMGTGACTTLSPAGVLDGYFSSESHEYAETDTDLWPDRGWLDSSGEEIADKCESYDRTEILTTGTFDVQGIWSDKESRCES